MRPIGMAELVFDQPIGGRGIGNAQQRFGEHHQGKALFGRKRIFAQNIFDAAEGGAGPDRGNEPRRLRIDGRLERRPQRGVVQQFAGELLVGGGKRRLECRNLWVSLGIDGSGHGTSQLAPARGLSEPQLSRQS